MAVDGLFGCQIISRPQNFLIVCDRQRFVFAFMKEPRQSQVKNFDNAFGIHQQVARFDVPVHHIRFMGMSQAFRCLADIVDGIANIQWTGFGNDFL